MRFESGMIYTVPFGLCLAMAGWSILGTSDGAPIVGKYADILNRDFPMTLSDGTYIDALKVDGDTLVFTIAPPANGPKTYASTDIEKMHASQVCAGEGGVRRLFENGGKVRIDVKNTNGSVDRGLTRSSC